MSPREVLDINNLSVERGGKPVINGLSLVLRPGQVTALLGPNGAGKSSLVLALAGVIPVASGTVMLGTQKLAGLRPDRIRQLGVAAVPEGHRTLTTMSVDDNLKAAGPMLTAVDLVHSVSLAYKTFPELAERKHQLAGTMSGGQQQMLALAQALVARPRFILADEMSFGLAPVIVRRLMQVVKDLAAVGTGVLLIEQFTDVALGLADEVHVISLGRLTFSGAAQTLKDKPEILHNAYLGVT